MWHNIANKLQNHKQVKIKRCYFKKLHVKVNHLTYEHHRAGL